MSETEVPANNVAPTLATLGIKDTDQVMVYDPKSEGLKLATGAQAKALAAQGYKIGPEAEYEATKNDSLTKVGTFLSHAGNMGSAGLLNTGLALSGRRNDLLNIQTGSQANKATALAGDLTGIGASMIGGGLAGAAEAKAGEYLGSTVLGKAAQAAAGTGRLANLGRAALRSTAQGFGTAASMGISSQATEDSIMKHPITAERLAQSAFTDILWNAAFNAGVHTVVSIPKAIRSNTGDLIDTLEKHKVFNHEQIAVPQQPQVGPQVAGWTQKYKNVSQDVETTDTLARDFNRELRDTKTRTNDFDREQKKTGTVVTDDDMVKNKTGTRTTTSRPKVTQTEEQMAADTATRDPINTTAAAPVKNYFDWSEHTPEEAKRWLASAIKHHLGKAEGHLDLWDQNYKLELRIQDAERKIKAGQHVELNEALKSDLQNEKELIKELLSEAHPSRMEGETGVPGFRELNDEYARLSGNVPKSDLKAPGFGAAVPPVKGAKAKPVRGRISETQTTGTETVNKDKNVQTDSLLTENSQRVQQEERKLDDTIKETSTKVHGVQGDTHTDELSIRWKPPKPQKQYVDGDIQSVFGNGLPATIAVGGRYLGLAAITDPLAAGMAGVNAFAKLANYRKTIGPWFERYGTRLMKSVAYPVEAGGRLYREQNKRSNIPPSYDTSHFQTASSAVNFAATNQEAVRATIERKYPTVAQDHPDTIAQVTATIMKGVHALDQQTPKKPFAPTLQPQTFAPTRAQQVKFMRTWRIIANTDEALSGADPQTVEMLKTVFPAWYEQATQELTHKAQTSKKRLSGRIARQVSTFTNTHVRATDDPKALKRLQETAGPDPKPQQGQQGPGGSKSTGGAKSAKVTQQAVTADATTLQQHQLGM